MTRIGCKGQKTANHPLIEWVVDICMKKKYRIVLDVLWFLLVLIPFIIMAFQVKYPSLDMNRFGWIVPVFFTLPIISLIISCISTSDRCRLKKVSDLIIYVGGSAYIIFLFVSTLGFKVWMPAVYPISSQTENPSNYLLIEDKFEHSEERYLNAVFPNEIPSNAYDVTYFYKCNAALGNYTIRAEWTLPLEDYVLIKEKEIRNKDNLIVEDGKDVYNIYMNNDKYFAKIVFNDLDNRVAYSLKSIG